MDSRVVVNVSQRSDVITPHRLTVAILIREFCLIRETSEVCRRTIRDFCILSLQLIQSPDLTLDELRNSMNEMVLNADTDLLKKNFDAVINDLQEIGVRYLLDIIESFVAMLAVNPGLGKFVSVNKNSVIGYYLRRFTVSFDRLSFSEVTTFCQSYKRYASGWNKTQSIASSETGNTLSSKTKEPQNNESGGNSTREWSRRQAELFIATQSSLILNNEERAMSPKELHENIKSLLKSNRSLSEAHFLNYLNYMRVKEYCGAIESLYHCFDRCADVNPMCSSEDKTKSYRYATLNLAILQYKFGHREEALAALEEAIKIAQAAGDNVCLQHALSWLYCLIQTNRHKLMEHSILKSLDLNLSYIMSLGIQSFIQYAGFTKGNPKQALDVMYTLTITKSDIVNCQQSYRDLISSSYAQKSAIWLFYGKTEMSSLWSQLLLYLNTDNPTILKTHYGEGYCQAICSMACHLHLEGEFTMAKTVIGFAKERFPNEPNSHTWMLCDNLMYFQQLIYNEKLSEAENVAARIGVVNKWESCLRMAEILIHRRDYKEAHKCVNQILEKFKDGSQQFRMDFQVRAMILLSEIQIGTQYPDATMPGILGLLNSTLAYANDYHLKYLASMAQLYIAHVQLLMGMSTQALSILDRCLVQILAHGGCYDRSRAMLLYVKCLVAEAGNKDADKRKADILQGLDLLKNVKKNFEKVEAFYRVKDVLYLQAQLYNEVDMTKERNQCALEFNSMNDNIPNINNSTLLISL